MSGRDPIYVYIPLVFIDLHYMFLCIQCLCVYLYSVCLSRLWNEPYEYQDQEMGATFDPDGRWTRIEIKTRIGTSANQN